MANNTTNNEVRAIFQEATVLSELMEDKEKIETEEIIKNFPEGITIDKVDLISVPDPKDSSKISDVYVYTFVENPKVFAFAGYVLAKCFSNAIEKGYAMDELGGVRVQLSSGKTKQGRPVTTVKVL